MFRYFLPLLLAATLGGVTIAVARPSGDRLELSTLPPTAAVGLRFDTLLLGGYAAGTYADAVRTLGADLSAEEKTLVGDHLDRIFEPVVPAAGLGRAGRLRVAFERALRPDGSIRSVRVLGAEVAVAGRLHSAFYFERDGRPGYFDGFGRAVDRDDWQGPLSAFRVSSAFGARRLHPILNRFLPHTGVDLAAPMGQPVNATADGVIIASGTRGGYGLLVEIRHPNGYSTRYAHLSRIAEGLEPGRSVRRGELIGSVGMSGLATGPHLHYEVLRLGVPVDPLRVGAEGPSAIEASGDPRWQLEKRRIGALLGRAPTVLQARTTPGGSGRTSSR